MFIRSLHGVKEAVHPYIFIYCNFYLILFCETTHNAQLKVLSFAWTWIFDSLCFTTPMPRNGIISHPRISKLYTSTAEMFVVCCSVKTYAAGWNGVTRRDTVRHSGSSQPFPLRHFLNANVYPTLLQTHWISCCLQTFLYHCSLFNDLSFSFYASLWETHMLAVSQVFVLWALCSGGSVTSTGYTGIPCIVYVCGGGGVRGHTIPYSDNMNEIHSRCGAPVECIAVAVLSRRL